MPVTSSIAGRRSAPAHGEFFKRGDLKIFELEVLLVGFRDEAIDGPERLEEVASFSCSAESENVRSMA
jgi:hypothetical protein